MELNISIGTRLREEREALKKSQTEFAEIAASAGVPGATRQSQARYEKGLATPSAAYMSAIAAAGADVLYILTGQRGAEPAASPLAREEEALLDNYRNSPPDGQAAIRATSAAFAQQAQVKKRGRAA